MWNKCLSLLSSLNQHWFQNDESRNVNSKANMQKREKDLNSRSSCFDHNGDNKSSESSSLLVSLTRVHDPLVSLQTNLGCSRLVQQITSLSLTLFLDPWREGPSWGYYFPSFPQSMVPLCVKRWGREHWRTFPLHLVHSNSSYHDCHLDTQFTELETFLS